MTACNIHMQTLDDNPIYCCYRKGEFTPLYTYTYVLQFLRVQQPKKKMFEKIKKIKNKKEGCHTII